MPRKKMNDSIRALARLAGVSSITAWRTVRGQYGVGEDTRRRIEGLARKHGIPLSATPARKNVNVLNTMCSLIPLLSEDDRAEHGFHRRLISGVEVGAESCGVEAVNIGRVAVSKERFEWPLMVNRRHVDGVVLYPAVAADGSYCPPLPGPVTSACILQGPPGEDVVTVDDFAGGLALGGHLNRLGHRRAAYIGPKTAMSLRRLSGLRLGLEPHGHALPPESVGIMSTAGNRESAMHLVDSILGRLRPGDTGPQGFTALMVYNDYMAAAAIMRLRERGVRVPEDVSVVGFDDVRPTWYEGPALTTVAMPLEEIGAEAVRMLYWRLAHPGAPPRRLVLNAALVAGESARAIG